MKLLLRSAPYEIFRCPGVKHDRNNNAYDKYLKHGLNPYLNERKDRINGVVGCWIAHSIALEDITEKNGITVVLEDDFVCQSHFFKNALNMVNSFDRDFDVIFFDMWGPGPYEIHKISENIYSPMSQTQYYGGSHCLFVNNAKVSKILETKLNSQVMDYDGFLLASPILDAYIFYTGDCTSRLIGSDITINTKLKYRIFDLQKYDLLGMLVCMLPYQLRERMPRFKRYFRGQEGIKSNLLTEEELKKFEGYYQHGKQQKIYIRFVVKDGRLLLLQPWGQPTLWFQPLSEVNFISKWTLGSLKFTKDIHGDVTMALLDKKNLWLKNNNYKEDSRKEIVLSFDMLKKFEGEYGCKQDARIIQIVAKDGYLLSKESCFGNETSFHAVSDLEFRDRNYPLFTLCFIQDNAGAITQFKAFFDLVIFVKIGEH